MSEEVHQLVIGRIEQFCIHLADPDFDGLAQALRVEPEVERIIAAVRAGRLPDSLAADLDTVERAFTDGKQMPGVTYPVREYRAVSGQPSQHPSVRVRRCPAPQRCSRLALPAEDPVPVCKIMECPLVEVELG